MLKKKEEQKILACPSLTQKHIYDLSQHQPNLLSNHQKLSAVYNQKIGSLATSSIYL